MTTRALMLTALFLAGQPIDQLVAAAWIPEFAGMTPTERCRAIEAEIQDVIRQMLSANAGVDLSAYGAAV